MNKEWRSKYRYRQAEGKGRRACNTCQNYCREDEGCTRISGIVSQFAICDLFARLGSGYIKDSTPLVALDHPAILDVANIPAKKPRQNARHP